MRKPSEKRKKIAEGNELNLLKESTNETLLRETEDWARHKKNFGNSQSSIIRLRYIKKSKWRAVGTISEGGIEYRKISFRCLPQS